MCGGVNTGHERPTGQDYNIVFSYTNGQHYARSKCAPARTTATRIKEVEYTYFISGTHSADVGIDGESGAGEDGGTADGRRSGHGGGLDRALHAVPLQQYGLLKAVFEPDAVQRLIDDRSDISSRGGHPDQGGR